MALPSIYVNGQNVDALGMRVETVRGHRDSVAITDPSIVIPGRAGMLRTGAAPTIAPREIVVTGKICEASGRTHGGLLTQIETLTALVALGLIEVRMVDAPRRAYMGRGRLEVAMIGPDFVATAAEFTLTVRCDDPFARDVDAQFIAFGADPTPVPVGNGPCWGIVRIMGAATNPVITLRDISGTPIHTLGYTRNLADGDYEETHLELMTVTRYQSGSATDDVAALTSGDVDAFVISPEDGDVLSGAYPTIECSGLGTGGGCELQYWRAW